MKKIITVTFLTLILFSCKKKEVHLPKVDANGLENIKNYSSIWLFNKNGTLDLNEKNRIASTNWLFNIDKTLTLEQVIPEITRLKQKHNEKSPHNTKKMNNYFSYANSINNKLSFYQFDTITYKFINKKFIHNYTNNDTTLVTILTSGDINKNLKAKTNKIIQLAFKNTLTFQDYLSEKTILDKMSYTVANEEYIIK